jgi:hypothetical protein
VSERHVDSLALKRLAELIGPVIVIYTPHIHSYRDAHNAAASRRFGIVCRFLFKKRAHLRNTIHMMVKELYGVYRKVV